MQLLKKTALLSLITPFAIHGVAQKPNIILILSDDMGFSDLGCYGGEISTPNLDELAANGIRFTQFYNSARSCPSRASLMTGLYPHQAGMGHMTTTLKYPKEHNSEFDGYQGFLNENCVTIAEVLKDAGYATLMAGKWHLGMENIDHFPLQRGFDRYYGLLAGACNYFNPVHPKGIFSNNEPTSIDISDYYTTNAFTDSAVVFIKESREANPEQPFFLYLAYNAPHWPLHASHNSIEKYRGKYMKGWGALRTERFRKMTEIGIIETQENLPPAHSRDWDSLSESKKEEMDLRMSIYAAQVEQMDDNIGRLMAYLKAEKLIDNTIIIFINDNGACAEGGEFGGGPVEQLETKSGYFLSYGQSWANASNTPLKSYKHWVYEGGISSPCIVYWPNGISNERRGSIIKQFSFLPDIMATCVDLAHTKYPEYYKGNRIHPLQGVSFIPLLKGCDKPIHTKPIFWEHEGNKAIRLGDYKLVMTWTDDKLEKWELYNINKDRSESHDLSAQMPDRVNNMRTMWYDWAKSSKVIADWSKIQKLVRVQNKNN